MPTGADPWHLHLPEHTTAWRSHLWIAHCLVIRSGKELQDLEATGFEALHDELHADPRPGTIHHVHDPRPETDPEDWSDDIW